MLFTDISMLAAWDPTRFELRLRKQFRESSIDR